MEPSLGSGKTPLDKAREPHSIGRAQMARSEMARDEPGCAEVVRFLEAVAWLQEKDENLSAVRVSFGRLEDLIRAAWEGSAGDGIILGSVAGPAATTSRAWAWLRRPATALGAAEGAQQRITTVMESDWCHY
eukprot:Skav205629  [mRNA]  locus=scaffold1575:111791:116855:+ [translate_table: standard]